MISKFPCAWGPNTQAILLHLICGMLSCTWNWTGPAHAVQIESHYKSRGQAAHFHSKPVKNLKKSLFPAAFGSFLRTTQHLFKQLSTSQLPWRAIPTGATFNLHHKTTGSCQLQLQAPWLQLTPLWDSHPAPQLKACWALLQEVCNHLEDQPILLTTLSTSTLPRSRTIPRPQRRRSQRRRKRRRRRKALE